MNTITLEVPEVLAELTKTTQQEVVLSALRKVARDKINDEIRQKREAESHLQRYEAKYHCKFKQFEQDLPANGNLQIHEDYIEWSFWQDVLIEAEKDIRTYQKLLGVTEDDS